MKLKSIMKKAADIAFKVAGDAKLYITFKSVVDDGFTDPTITETNVYAIRENFTTEDIRSLKFGANIQPYDMKLLVKCNDLDSVDTNDKVIVDSIEFSIFGIDKDPADAVWTIGVR